jgi:hypothetical protein
MCPKINVTENLKILEKFLETKRTTKIKFGAQRRRWLQPAGAPVQDPSVRPSGPAAE